MYEISVAPSLRPPGTSLKRLRNKNMNVHTQFKHVSRYPRVSTPIAGLVNITGMLEKHLMPTPPPPSHLGMPITF